MDDLFFREHSKPIRISRGLETIDDPFEKNVTVVYLNPLPIRAIISDLTMAKVNYAMPGISTDKAKEIIIEKKRRHLIERSHRIEIAGEYYEGWRVNGKAQMREEGNYLRIYIYIKKV
ncbi:MAG: hypothetical protein ABGF52_13620 [Candidatus Asgardarchaeum sp.]